MDFACWGSFGKSPAGGRRAEVLPGPGSPAPALARDSLRPVSAGDRYAGARGTAPGAGDKPEARRVAARGSAAVAAPRTHGDRAGFLGNWSWPGLPLRFEGTGPSLSFFAGAALELAAAPGCVAGRKQGLGFFSRWVIRRPAQGVRDQPGLRLGTSSLWALE